MSSPYLPKTVRSFLKISIGMHWQRRKWAQLKSYKRGAKTVCREGLLQKAQREERGQGVISISFSCCVLYPWPWGSDCCWLGQLHALARLSMTPPTLSPGSQPQRSVFLSFVSGAGHTCKNRCPIWQGASKFQRSRGLDAQCLGNSFPLSVPSFSLSHLHGPKGILWDSEYCTPAATPAASG